MPAFRGRFEAAWQKFGNAAPFAFIDLLPAAGKTQLQRELLRRWEDGSLPATAFDRARAHYALGEHAEAVAWLSRSLEELPIGPAFLARYDALWPGLREAPGYRAFIAHLDANVGNPSRTRAPPRGPAVQASLGSR